MRKNFAKAVALCTAATILSSMNMIAFADEKETSSEAQETIEQDDKEKDSKTVEDKEDTKAVDNKDGQAEEIEVAGAGISVRLDKYYEKTKSPTKKILKVIKKQEAEKKEKDAVAQNHAKREEYFKGLAIAKVDSYVNVRKKPNVESKIVGKIYGHCAATIVSEKDGWYKITSGNVEGYIKSEYFVTGTEAEKYAVEMGYVLATVNVPGLNLRENQGKKASKIQVLPEGDKYSVLQYGDGWAELAVDEETDGWVTMDYVDISVNCETAITLKEEQAQIEREEELYRKEQESIQASDEASRATEQQTKRSEDSPKQQPTAQQPTTPQPATQDEKSYNPSTSQSVISYAKQFIGNPYVYGGSSLTGGTDCSGFTMSVYAHYGYYLNRSSSSQTGNGVPVSLDSLKPGDLVFYAPSGIINHVAIYIGGGQIVHASSPSTGIMISSINYGSSPYCARRIIQ